MVGSVTRSSPRNSVSMEPTRLTVPWTPPASTSFNPSSSFRPFSSNSRYTPGASSALRVAKPAVTVTGFPERVPAW